MKPDRFDVLVNALLPFAQQSLGQHGGFYPFAGLMAKDGSVAVATGEIGKEPATEWGSGDANALRECLVSALEADVIESGHLATCVCVDVTFEDPRSGKKTDAVLFCLEQSEGDAIDLFLPYQQLATGAIEYGEFIAVEGQRRVFPSEAEGV